MKKAKKDKGIHLIEEMKLQNSALEKIKADVNKSVSKKAGMTEAKKENQDKK